MSFTRHIILVKQYKKDKQLKNDIAKTWISGQKSCTLIIRRELAQEYGLLEPSHVVLERRPEGILIRKLKTEF
jgi:hypothetical protein